MADSKNENNDKSHFDLITDGDGAEDFDSDGFWWETKPPRDNAVAYYRHSTQDKQKNSIEIQAEQVRGGFISP